MNTENKKKRKGVLTVEAMIILPLFYMVFMFIISILSLSYHHLVMQQALNNAGRTLAQYTHLVNMFIDVKELGLKGEVNDKEENLEEKLGGIKDNLMGDNGLTGNIKSVMQDFTGGGSGAPDDGLIPMLQNDFIGNLINGNIKAKVEEAMSHFDALSANAKAIKENAKAVGTTAKSITKDDLFNYFISSLVGTAGGKFLELMIGDYLTEAQASAKIFTNLEYHLYIDAETADFILVAEYDYKLPFNLIGTYHIQQSVRVHPWIGGNNSEGFK